MIPSVYSGPLFANRRIGLLGGSFNPAHQGHVAMSLFALKRLKLDQIWWLVSPQNPLKSSQDMAPFDGRFQRARALTRGHSRLVVSDLEARLGTRYTVDTLISLQKRMPHARFVWLMGMDNLEQIDRWQRWETLFERVPIAVFRRRGYAAAPNVSKAAQRFAKAELSVREAINLAIMDPPAWLVLDNPYNELSATQIRQKKLINTQEGKQKRGSSKKSIGKKTTGKEKKFGKKSFSGKARR